jgi:6-pyruvoyltetrahydropterin/6-carboxytetrahydropterin synthase
MIVARREHEFSYGHRVVGHEGKCKQLHGHNAKVTFVVSANDLDSVGRVIDFSVIKSTLCQWLEDNWDHKLLMWEKDPMTHALERMTHTYYKEDEMGNIGLVIVPFNPTAENMALYLLTVVGPKLLLSKGVALRGVEFFETSKCSVYVGEK